MSWLNSSSALARTSHTRWLDAVQGCSAETAILGVIWTYSPSLTPAVCPSTRSLSLSALHSPLLSVFRPAVLICSSPTLKVKLLLQVWLALRVNYTAKKRTVKIMAYHNYFTADVPMAKSQLLLLGRVDIHVNLALGYLQVCVLRQQL